MQDLIPALSELAPFTGFSFEPFAGRAGAFVARSLDDKQEAIAERLETGWQLWIVRTIDGETLWERFIPCAS